MAVVTITRTPWIDDDGTGTTGTVINNAEKTLLYNQIDAALAQLMPLSGGTQTSPLSVAAMGPHTITAGATGYNSLSVSNTVAGAGNAAQINVQADGGAGLLALNAYSSTFTATPLTQAGGSSIIGTGVGGLSVATTNAAGTLRFYTGGVQCAQFNSSGLLTVSTPGTHRFAASAVGGQSLLIQNTAVGATNFCSVNIGNDANANLFQLLSYSTTYVQQAQFDQPNSVLLFTLGAAMSLCCYNSSPIRFLTNATERMRLDAAGRLLINTLQTPLGAQAVVVGFTGDGGYAGLSVVNVGTSGYFAAFFNNASGLAGAIQHTTSTTVAYSTTSDARLKTDRGRATDLAALRAVVVHDFDWVADGHADRGVFAQETAAVFSRAITEGTDEITESGTLARPWMTDYSKFVADLIVGFQQHDADLAALRAELATLKGSN